MRAVFSIAALLIVLAVIGVVAQRQLSATRATAAPAGEAAAPVVQHEQPRQQVEQFKRELDQALQQGAARNQAAD